MSRIYILLPWLLAAHLQAGQSSPDASPYEGALRVGNGVSPPHVLRKIDPEFSPEARNAHIQGTVICQLIVTEKGRAAGITVLSPLGFGLDERAEEAIARWEFSPGMKDGKPVKILATIEVNFRFENSYFDTKTEAQRTSYNLALQALRKQPIEPKILERAIKTMTELSTKGYPPAMLLAGRWQLTGNHVPKDPEAGMALIQKAATKNFGPALYEIAVREIEGTGGPGDPAKGAARMRRAADLGSAAAQFYLGNLYEKGLGITRDPSKASSYFRLCASHGNPECELRLGVLLLESPQRPERDLLQALAWLQLSSEGGIPAAKDLASRESAGLTPVQARVVSSMKAQLLHKDRFVVDISELKKSQ